MSEMTQLLLNLAHRPAFERADFLCAPCNEAALKLIDSHMTWQNCTGAIYGPASCGKTHLAAVFCEQTGGARQLDAEMLPAASLMHTAMLADMLTPHGAVVDGVDALPPQSEETMFHLINLAKENNVPLLLTSRVPLAQINIGLDDLRSRLRAVMAVALSPPDDALLRALMRKLFRDRQLRVPQAVIDYLAPRIDRDFETVTHLVRAIDNMSLTQQRAVSVPLVAAILNPLLASSHQVQ